MSYHVKVVYKTSHGICKVNCLSVLTIGIMTLSRKIVSIYIIINSLKSREECGVDTYLEEVSAVYSVAKEDIVVNEHVYFLFFGRIDWWNVSVNCSTTSELV